MPTATHGTPASMSPNEGGPAELCGPGPSAKAGGGHDPFPRP
jgi:hypothetical protein